MADVILFHSAYGLRPAVLRIAGRLRRLGHRVATPDLYNGRVVDTLEEAVSLRDEIGRAELARRAQASTAQAPQDTVLAGFSMGASLALRVAAREPRFSRLLLFHGVTEPPSELGIPWRVQAHLSEDDPTEPRSEVLGWRHALQALGAQVDLHFYRGGHLFTDPDLPDHAPAAAAQALMRAERFLSQVPRTRGR